MLKKMTYQNGVLIQNGLLNQPPLLQISTFTDCEHGWCWQEFGEGVTSTCPNQGNVAPNFANGEMNAILDGAFDSALASLARRWRQKLTEAQWQKLLLDFSTGKAHLLYVIIPKLSAWSVLPWFLCVLGHAHEAVARQGAKTILRMWEACADPAAHHRLTVYVCSPDTAVGEQLRLFAVGAERRSLPALYAIACKLAMVPVTERCVEAPHGRVKIGSAFKNAGPLEVALVHCFPDIQKYNMSDQASLDPAACCERTKSMTSLPRLLGIMNHPLLQGLGSTSKNIKTAVVKILYRCDVASQFGHDTARLQKEHEIAKRRRLSFCRVAVGEPAGPPRLRLSAAGFECRLSLEHFRSKADVDAVYSLPVHGGVRPQPFATQVTGPGLMQSNENTEADVPETTDLAQLADEEGESRIFFEVVHLAPSRQRLQERPAAAAIKLKAPDLAVSLVHAAQSLGGGSQSLIWLAQVILERSTISNSSHCCPLTLTGWRVSY